MENFNITIQEEVKKAMTWHQAPEFIQAIRRSVKVWSWGPQAFKLYDKKIVRFKVNAHRFKGHVYLWINFSDTMEVRLVTTKGRLVKEWSGIYIDQVIDVIDREIEYIAEYTR